MVVVASVVVVAVVSVGILKVASVAVVVASVGILKAASVAVVVVVASVAVAVVSAAVVATKELCAGTLRSCGSRIDGENQKVVLRRPHPSYAKSNMTAARPCVFFYFI